jgi:hypothetical protein
MCDISIGKVKKGFFIKKNKSNKSSNKKKGKNVIIHNKATRREGIEPSIVILKTTVLPLNYPPYKKIKLTKLTSNI